jgi:hypothetical protein
MRIVELLTNFAPIKPLSPKQYGAYAKRQQREREREAAADKQKRDAAQQARQRAVWGKRAVLPSISQKAAGLQKRRKAAR